MGSLTIEGEGDLIESNNHGKYYEVYTGSDIDPNALVPVRGYISILPFFPFKAGLGDVSIVTERYVWDTGLREFVWEEKEQPDIVFCYPLSGFEKRYLLTPTDIRFRDSIPERPQGIVWGVWRYHALCRQMTSNYVYYIIYMGNKATLNNITSVDWKVHPSDL